MVNCSLKVLVLNIDFVVRGVIPNEEGNYWHYNENNVAVICQ